MMQTLIKGWLIEEACDDEHITVAGKQLLKLT